MLYNLKDTNEKECNLATHENIDVEDIVLVK